MSPCLDRPDLQAYLDHDLPESEARRFERHLATCSECAADLELFRRVFALASSLPLLDPPPGLTQRVRERVLPSRSRRRAWIRRAGLAYAGAVAACLAGFVYWAMHPAAQVMISALAGTAARRLTQIAIFTLNAGTSTLLGIMNGWGLLSTAGARIAPIGRVVAAVFEHPSVSLTLWLAALACAALLWWMRGRGRGGRMRHVGVLGF